jgi:uncharacterized protein (DUF433 family)
VTADVVELLDRPVYGMSQVDRLLGLTSGTARRWIDGYKRGKREYPPVVRLETTHDELVTWGEFVETRLLAEYRGRGVSVQHMRPAIDRLRDRFDTRYPLAHARPFTLTMGRELVLEVQDDVGLDRHLHLVVARNDQIVLTDPALQFVESAEFGQQSDVVERLRPVTEVGEVVIDPLRQFGEPVVGSVRTEILAEQYRAGETIEGISRLFDLDGSLVEAALRYELIRSSPEEIAA